MSFALRIARDGGLPVCFLTSEDVNGQPAYYFLLCNRMGMLSLKHALKQKDSCNLADFGKVVASGFGHEPEPIVQSYMRDVYGFDYGKLLVDNAEF